MQFLTLAIAIKAPKMLRISWMNRSIKNANSAERCTGELGVECAGRLFKIYAKFDCVL
jgi:hypothetical protein